MEVIKERLERESALICWLPRRRWNTTCSKRGGEMVSLHSPQEMPDAGEIERVEEPYLKAKILIPPDYVGAVMDLTVGRRGDVRHHELPVADYGRDDLGDSAL